VSIGPEFCFWKNTENCVIVYSACKQLNWEPCVASANTKIILVGLFTASCVCLNFTKSLSWDEEARKEKLEEGTATTNLGKYHNPR